MQKILIWQLPEYANSTLRAINELTLRTHIVSGCKIVMEMSGHFAVDAIQELINLQMRQVKTLVKVNIISQTMKYDLPTCAYAYAYWWAQWIWNVAKVRSTITIAGELQPFFGQTIWWRVRKASAKGECEKRAISRHALTRRHRRPEWRARCSATIAIAIALSAECQIRTI